MKRLFIALAVIAISLSSFAQESATTTFKVWGNCGMCKQTIEKAAKTEGVSAATWNVETKMLELTYQPGKTTPEKVQQKIAATGYDTEKVTGDNKAYDKLHGCCKYERKASEVSKEKCCETNDCCKDATCCKEGKCAGKCDKGPKGEKGEKNAEACCATAGSCCKKSTSAN